MAQVSYHSIPLQNWNGCSSQQHGLHIRYSYSVRLRYSHKYE